MKELLQLDEVQARVLGVLIEKELTTPENYPLSLNGLTAGCNQKSNRDPKMDLGEATVNSVLDRLVVHGYVGRVSTAGSRVEKFRHNAREMWAVDTAQVAILAELLLRGPQAKGELRSRVKRMFPLDSLEALTDAAQPLFDGGLIRMIEPAAGSRTRRFAELLTTERQVEEVPPAEAVPARPSEPAPPSSPPTGLGVRVAALEEEVATLRRQLDDLAQKLGEPLS